MSGSWCRSKHHQTHHMSTQTTATWQCANRPPESPSTKLLLITFLVMLVLILSNHQHHFFFFYVHHLNCQQQQTKQIWHTWCYRWVLEKLGYHYILVSHVRSWHNPQSIYNGYKYLSRADLHCAKEGTNVLNVHFADMCLNSRQSWTADVREHPFRGQIFKSLCQTDPGFKIGNDHQKRQRWTIERSSWIMPVVDTHAFTQSPSITEFLPWSWHSQ